MSLKSKLGIGKGALILAGINLLLFLLVFLPIYVIDDLDNLYYYILRVGDYSGFFYFVSHLEEAFRYFSPVFAGVLMCQKYASFGLKKTLTAGLKLSAASLIYTIPFCYLYAMSNGAYTVEALLWGAFVSLIYMIILYIQSLIMFVIIKRTVCYFNAKAALSELPPLKSDSSKKAFIKEHMEKSEKNLAKILSSGDTFDFSNSGTLGVFFASLLNFTIYLVKEIIGTASYLKEYAGTYRTEEIGYMVFRFIFILALLFICHAVCHFVKSKSEYLEAEE